MFDALRNQNFSGLSRLNIMINETGILELPIRLDAIKLLLHPGSHLYGELQDLTDPFLVHIPIGIDQLHHSRDDLPDRGDIPLSETVVQSEILVDDG